MLNIHGKNWCWSWSFSNLATWCEELTHWKRPWWWEILKAGGEGDDRGQDGWVTSPTRWTWVWASSGSWWQTGKYDMSHAVHGVTKSLTRLSNWTELTDSLLKTFTGFLYSSMKSISYINYCMQSFLGFSDIFNIFLLSHTLNSLSILLHFSATYQILVEEPCIVSFPWGSSLLIKKIYWNYPLSWAFILRQLSWQKSFNKMNLSAIVLIQYCLVAEISFVFIG